ncbi:carbon-nitrogen hydrolase family protein [Ramlibacter sp.]|uniref:carbon-nitrogen hydrolase family protein n=1 Tax=Ramlibacter sp. TaxID=1917967 RepID=UPI002C45E664|nr:carbon-nitrogen hydrolase family protein [Ramlibacter sp.]HWI82178.1 carbon-nitrogen hydrolase family protein [Ramlibacter sp.]
MSSTLTAAVAQTATVLLDTPATLERALALMAEAAARGVQLLVFPEAFLGGYPKGADFHIYLGGRTPEGRAEFRRYHEAAVTVDGPEIAQLAKAAARHQMYAVVGIIERDGGTLYCTAVYLGPDGRVLGKHRKLMPTALERLVWGFGDGSTLAAVDTPFGRLGAVICWENYMPALRMAMYQQRVALYCAPTADDRDTWAASMQHIALEGRCFVLSACQHLRRSQFPDAIANRLPGAADTVLMRGGSVIVNPLGQLLAGPVFNEDALLTAELDLGLIPMAQMDFDAVGHYARPDVFSLHVNTAPQHAVCMDGGPSGE